MRHNAAGSRRGSATRMDAGTLGRPGVLLAAYAALLALVAAALYYRLPAPLDAIVSDAQVRSVRAQYPRPAANEVVVGAIEEPFLESVREPIALLHPHIA